MLTFKEPTTLQHWAVKQKRKGRRIALVPTMGYLHEGHLSLIRRAKQKCSDEIVVSIFVNPVQFGPKEDYAKYPRDLAGDLKKCEEAGATAVFVPQPETMYPKDFSVFVNEEELSKGLCGAKRPGHFKGVCTVITKLFNLIHPNVAVFGQKDYQQAQIIKRLVRDLNYDIEVVVSPIVRESTGLAKSSRNTYLKHDDLNKALAISLGLRMVKRAHISIAQLKKRLVDAGLKVDYVEAVDAKTLKPVKKIKHGVCVLVAAYAGKTRLIDNVLI